MDIRDALKGQYHAAFRMLRQCVELCPDDIWYGGDFPRHPWRIAYHAAFYGQLYLGQNEASFVPWHRHHPQYHELWVEEGELMPALSQPDLLEYIDWITPQINDIIDGLDLDTSDPGFDWYKNITKLEHEILSIRHIQGHVGQLSELLFRAGIETNWYARRV